MTAPADSDTG